MILPFSTKFPNGDKTYFIEKIWEGLLDNYANTKYLDWRKYFVSYKDKIGEEWDIPKCKTIAKSHTIREDVKNRWKVGNKIHFIVFNRSEKQFQFAPVIEVKSIQKINIFYYDTKQTGAFQVFKDDERWVNVYVDGNMLSMRDVVELAENDGFESVLDFFKWFDSDFKGKIIHWTDLKY